MTPDASSTPLSLSLVVPVYNAPDLAATLLEQLPELAVTAANCGFRLVETILVDDGSTPPLCIPPDMDTQVRVLRHEPNRGKGFSVKRGALAARGAYVLMSDVDLSAPFREFVRLAVHADAWMVCGSRYGRPGMPWRRRFLSGLFHGIVWLAGVRGVHDTQCGFKLFRMDVMRPIFEAQRIERFAFDVEIVSRVQRGGGTVAEVPVAWKGGKRSSLRVSRDAPRMLWDLLRICFAPAKASLNDATAEKA